MTKTLEDINSGSADRRVGAAWASVAYLIWAVLSASFGILFAPFGKVSIFFTVFSIALFSMPALVYPAKLLWAKIWACWLSVFLIVQTLLSPVLIDYNLVLRPPHLDITTDVEGGLPGIQGLQRYTTDDYGFRTYPPADYRSSNAFRIFAIGGSTTIDDYLDDQKTWTHLLQERLGADLARPVEIINTGVPGLRATHHLSTLRYIEKLRPDMVIFLLGANDWVRHIYRQFGFGDMPDKDAYCVMRHPCFNVTLAGSALLRLWDWARNGSPSTPQTRVEHGEYYSKQRGSLYRQDQRQFFPPSVLNSHSSTMEEIAKECLSSKVDCVSVTQPNGYSLEASEDFVSGFWMTPPNTSYTLSLESMQYLAKLYNDYLLSYGKQRGFVVCDLASEIPASYEALDDDMHFNTRGAALVAEKLEPCIMQAIAASKRARSSG